MEMIYYKKQQVKVGEFVKYKGAKIQVTQDVVRENPELFEVIDKEKYEEQQLLEEAKEKFPIGTKFKCLYYDKVFTVSNVGYWDVDKINKPNCCIWFGVEEQASGEIHANGKWAKRYLFTSEDGIDIFEDDKIIPVAINNEHGYKKHTFINQSWSATKHTIHNGFIYFSSHKAAKEYLESLKEKTLQDYEDMLLKSNSLYKSTKHKALALEWFWDACKNNEPNLYWIKVLQLIADDLNDGWKPDWYNSAEDKFIITRIQGEYIVSGSFLLQTKPVFKSDKLVEKAIKLMGDNLKHLFV